MNTLNKTFAVSATALITAALFFVFCGGEGTPDYCSDGYPQNQYTEFCYGGETFPLCGGKEFVPPEEFCDDNEVYKRCGETKLIYAPATQFCSLSTIHNKCAGQVFDPQTQGCVNNVILTSCGTNYYNASTHFCDGEVVRQKCGGAEYVTSTHFCSNNAVFERCGDYDFDPAIYYCLDGKVAEKCPGGNYNDDGLCVVDNVAEYSVQVASRGNGTLGSGTYREGSTVTIVAGTAPENEVFKNWTTQSAGVTFADSNSNRTTFIMPKDNVVVDAIFEPIPYTVTVVSIGTGASGGGEYRADDTVWINAGTMQGNHVFQRWTSADVTLLMNVNSADNAFIMPAKNVTVTASFMRPQFNRDVTYGSFIDGRDGQTYYTVVIGGQTWMAENLNYNTQDKTTSWCYDGNADMCETYGRLYRHTAAVTVCPQGWRTPTEAMWETLIDSADGSSDAGVKLKSEIYWDHSGGGTNDFGFSALPGGVHIDHKSGEMYQTGRWWTSTMHVGANPIAIQMTSSRLKTETITLDSEIDADGFYSVRCIMND